MSVLKIARAGHPVLRRRADAVAAPKAPEIKALVVDMLETLEESGGIGLAAPQVHVPLRVVIFHVPALRNAGEAVPMTILINPVIEPLGEGIDLAFEACLSLPGMTGEVPRWTHIRYSGVDLAGNHISREARNFHARVVQHECDHLDGTLYPQRMRDLSRFGFVEYIRRALSEEETGNGN